MRRIEVMKAVEHKADEETRRLFGVYYLLHERYITLTGNSLADEDVSLDRIELSIVEARREADQVARQLRAIGRIVGANHPELSD